MTEAKDTVIDIGTDEYDGLGADILVEIQADITWDKALKDVGELLDKWWNEGRGGKQNWYKLEALIKALKRGEMPNVN